MKNNISILMILLLTGSIFAGTRKASPFFQEFIKRLQKDKYRVTLDDRDRDLDFGTDKGEYLKTPKGSCITYDCKRTYPLKKPKGGWYPGFRITEITYSDSTSAALACKKIDRIINTPDRSNDKRYDFIVQNGNRLIYVMNGAMIFKAYAFAYKPVLLEMIQNHKQ